MKTVKITEDFEGWPTGKAPVRYAKGDEVEVSDAFADLIVGKGHAKEMPTKTATAQKDDRA